MEEKKDQILLESESKKECFRTLTVADVKYKTLFTSKYLNRKKYSPKDKSEIRAFLPGTIKKVFVKKGKKVKEGEKLLILEAMKMKNEIFSPLAGVVKEVLVKEGVNVIKDELLLKIG